MVELEFEKVGDINALFPYLCVYFKGSKEPFMEIGISDKEVVEYIFYPHAQELMLSSGQWNLIFSKGQVFLDVELKNKKFEDEWGASD